MYLFYPKKRINIPNFYTGENIFSKEREWLLKKIFTRDSFGINKSIINFISVNVVWLIIIFKEKNNSQLTVGVDN